MMYTCFYDVGKTWYDVIMVKIEWYIHGKCKNKAIIMPVLQGQYGNYSSKDLNFEFMNFIDMVG